MIDLTKLESVDGDYYNIGDRDNIVISSSVLQYIDPTQDGHPKKFLEALEQKEDKKISFQLNNGSLLHEWIERKDQFAIADINKPTEARALLIEKFYNAHLTSVREDSQFEQAGTDKVTKEAINSLIVAVEGKTDYTTSDYIHMHYCFRRAIEEADYKGAKKYDTVAKHLIECLDYFKFLQKADGKVIMTKATEEIVKNAYASLENNDRVNHLLFKESGNGIQVIKELALFFDYKNAAGDVVKVKGKLDNLHIDFNRKVIILNDLKTYGRGSIYNKFVPIRAEDIGKTSFEFYRIYRQLAIYRMAIARCLIEKYEELKGFKVLVNIIGVETTDFYASDVFPIHNSWLFAGKREFEDLCARIIWHRENRYWNRPMESVKGFEVLSYSLNV